VIEQVRKGNYERIFDTARTRVRAWEALHIGMVPASAPDPWAHLP